MPSLPAMDEFAAIRAWESVVGQARLEPMDRVHNPIWRVIGEDGREWVLKHLPNVPPGVGPVEEYRVLCYLEAAGLPVAVPIVTDDGTIAFNADNLRTDPRETQPTGDQAYVLIPLLPSDPELHESPQLAHTIGAGIARLDRALAQCPWQVVSFTDDPARQILGNRYARLPQELRALTAPLCDRLCSAVVDLPSQRTHGDCNVGNLLVDHGAVTGYIDLDHLPTGPRIYDLANYLITRLKAHMDHGDPEAMTALLPHYVTGYHATYALNERELAAVVPLMLTFALHLADWHLHSQVPDPVAYQRDRRAIEWLTPRYDDLARAATPR